MFRSRRLRRATSFAVSAAALLTTTFAALPAQAVEPVVDGPLAFTAPTGFTVDSAHHHLLFASSSTNGVIVTDLDGNVNTTLVPASTISDIVTSPDGVYAWASSAAPLTKLYRIKLADLTVTSFSLGATHCPDSVTVVNATYVAFGYACDGQWGGVGVLNVTNGQVNVAGSEYNPRVRAVPGTSHFISGDIGEDPAQIGLWSVGTGTPTSVITSGSVGSCENLGDIAVNPDGSSFVLACGSPYQHQEFSTVDFSGVATYNSGTYPTAAAFSPDGNYLAAGMDGVYWDDVAMFNHGDGSQVYSLDYSDNETAGPTTPPHGLAFSADSTQLYALALDTTVTPNDLYLVTLPVSSAPTFPPPVVVPPVVAPPVASNPHGSAPGSGSPVTAPPALPVVTAVSVTSPPRAFVGEPLLLTGGVTFAGVPTAGIQLMVSKTVAGVRSDVGSVKTTSLGAYSYAVTLTAVGNATYSVGFVGDPAHYGSSASTTIAGSRAPAQLSLKVAKLKGKVYAVTAHLTSWGVNRHVVISANKKIIGNGVVNSKGLLTVHFTRKKATTFMAVFTGDKNDYPARATKGLH